MLLIGKFAITTHLLLYAVVKVPHMTDLTFI